MKYRGQDLLGEHATVLNELQQHDYALRPIEIAELCRLPLRRVRTVLEHLLESGDVITKRLAHDAVVNDGGAYVLDVGIGFKAVMEKRK